MSYLDKFSKRQIGIAAAAMVAGAGMLVVFIDGGRRQPVIAASGDEPAITKSVVAGPGLVEPESEDVQVGSELAGKLKEVLAEEGDHVRKGQVLAVLVNGD